MYLETMKKKWKTSFSSSYFSSFHECASNRIATVVNLFLSGQVQGVSASRLQFMVSKISDRIFISIIEYHYQIINSRVLNFTL